MQSVPRKSRDGSVTIRWGEIDQKTGIAWDGDRTFKPGEPGYEAALAEYERHEQFQRETAPTENPDDYDWDDDDEGDIEEDSESA